MSSINTTGKFAQTNLRSVLIELNKKGLLHQASKFFPNSVNFCTLQEAFTQLGEINIGLLEYKLFLITQQPVLAKELSLEKDNIEKEIFYNKHLDILQNIEHSPTIDGLKTLRDFVLTLDVTSKKFPDDNDWQTRVNNVSHMFFWGCPTDESLNFTANILKTNPESRLIEFGSGTGAYLSLLSEKDGVSSDRLIGLDLEPHSAIGYGMKPLFFPIIQVEPGTEFNYVTITPDDIVLIVWGHSQSYLIEQCVKIGVSKFIIQGEPDCGCTIMTNYFENISGWTVKSLKLTTKRGLNEFITFSQKS